MGRNSRRRRERRDRNNDMHRMTPENRGEGIWVFSEWLPDGGYGVTVSYGEDHVWPLDNPVKYAADVAEVAITAQHDTAVFRLALKRLGMPLDVIGELMRLLRGGDAGRPAVEVLPGLTMTPGVSFRKIHPFIEINVKGAEPSQVDSDQILRHAHGALALNRAAPLDTALRAMMTDPLVGVDDATASAMVDGLSEFWPRETGR